MNPLFRQVVFSVGEAEYLWGDVVEAARLRGDWAPLRERALAGIACLARLEEAPDALDDADVESAANDFRYERDLISADEMEAWLALWGLTPESWMDYIRVSLLRQKWSGDLPETALPPAEEAEIESRALAEAICSGELRRLAGTLAGRVAIASRDQKHGARPGLEALEASFRRFSESALTADVVKAQIRAGQTDWTRLDCQQVSFPNEEAAREAALCVRVDGRALTDVARDADREMRREDVYVEDTPPDSRALFLAAGNGELIGPVRKGEEFLLYLVLRKVVPSESDENVVSRARATALARLVDQEINDRVKWRWRF
ncbi:MAG TPA: hypothetical protein VE007_01180 [Thermoanaerobaculia bacterium]|nr:hypothetical protein [Thermoanaerobaculia bacterium]